MYTSAIRHPAKSSFVQIHEWQLAATDGDKAAAALLSVFEHRHNAIVANREYDLLVRTSAEAAGFILPPDFRFWFCMTDEQLLYRVKIAKKESMYKGIDVLRTKGLIDTDPPVELRELVATGRRKWFLLNVDAINAFIDRYAPGTANPTETPSPAKTPAVDAASAGETPAKASMMAQCREVFDDWKTLHESPRSIPDPKRLKLVERLLTLKPEPYSIDRLKLAIRGILTLEHNMGGTNGRLYNQFELIFRDAQHVERYEAAALQLGITTDNYRDYTISKSDPVFRRITNAAAAVPSTEQTPEQIDIADNIADALASGIGVDAVIKMIEKPWLVTAALVPQIEQSYRTYSVFDKDAKKRIQTVVDRIVRNNERTI